MAVSNSQEHKKDGKHLLTVVLSSRRMELRSSSTLSLDILEENYHDKSEDLILPFHSFLPPEEL